MTPFQITFNLYDSKTALTPIATQTFPKGKYTVDFEFSKSDGVTSGNVARIKANFTNILNISDDPDTSARVKEIWVGIEVAGTEIGDRAKVSDETLVQLLLASDASIATYLTLVYKGDENPITTIYKGLPLSALSSDSSESSLSSYFSTVAASSSEGEIIGPTNVAGSDGQIQYNNSAVQAGASQFYYDDTNHRVGIGTTSPAEKLEVTSLAGTSITTKSTASDQWARFQFLSGTADWRILGYGQSYTGYENKFSIYGGASGSADHRITITGTGNVGIGTINPSYKLAVNGTIRAKEIIVDTGWSDFVFEDNYRLPSLDEVERFISDNRHLPGIPSEAEVKEKGVTLGSISSKLLQKIEELTLYVINLKKENDSLKAEMTAIQAQLSIGVK